MKPIFLECYLSQETCEERLRSHAAILCDVTDFGFKMRPKAFGGLSPRCLVRFKPIVRGTRIELRTEMHPFHSIFMFVWLLGIFGGGGYIFIASALTLLGANVHIISPIAGMVAPPIMFAFACLFVRGDRRRAAAVQANIVSFLGREIESVEKL